MRIVNISGSPLYLSYGTKTKGGIILQPNNQTVVEVPITVVHNPQLWKDIASNKVQFKLSAEDHAFIKRITDHDGTQLKHVEPAVRQPAPKPAVNVKPAMTLHPQSPFKRSITDFVRAPSVQVIGESAETDIGVPRSLKDIQRMNAGNK